MFKYLNFTMFIYRHVPSDQNVFIVIAIIIDYVDNDTGFGHHKADA